MSMLTRSLEHLDDRFAQLPRALRDRSIITRLAQADSPSGEPIPALLAHPDEKWHSPGATPALAPVVIWMHGRTVNKELDPGRYLRWVRAGIAACAIDLPGHGERFSEAYQHADHTLQLIKQAAAEIDAVLNDLAHPRFNGAFDRSRIALGGMSAGGMVALHRLCADHPFTCACVEATAGALDFMKGRDFYREPLATELDPIRHIASFRPIPLLALHSRADEWIPVEAISTFLDALRLHYKFSGADPATIELKTWERTGAPNEHYGFGTAANEAKNTQTDFLVRCLKPTPPDRA
jgi:dienelactone hydrolase